MVSPGLLSSRSFHTDDPLAIFGQLVLGISRDKSEDQRNTFSFPMEIYEVYDGAELDIGGFIR